MESEVLWHHGQTLAAGQVVEFKVWAELVRQSAGGLHIFLPLRDRGIDGVLHRMSDGEYFPVQVKGRTELTPRGQVHLTVTASSLVDDDALIMGALIDGPDLGTFVLVVSEADFRRLATHDWLEGREYLTAAFELHAGGKSRWAPFLVPRDRLAERFGVMQAAVAAPAATVDRASEGFLGEAEVIRQLATGQSLALFRPFPDLETVELLARHMLTRRFAGLQVKTAGWDPSHSEQRIYIRRSSFRAAESTFVCVLALNRVAKRFAETCLLIPSLDITRLARVEGEWFVLEIQPGSASHRRLDRYSVSLQALGETVEARLR